MSEKNYLWILKGGVFASFIILFFSFSSFLFPFISSKQLPFNLLIEVLFIIYLIFLIQYPKYAPRKSYLSWALFAYFIAIALSLVVSVDFNLSFWGDIERMLGFFHLLHFLIFYIIIISVFKTRKDYQSLLYAIVFSALGIAFYGFYSGVAHSTIGNRAYVAAIMLFAMFLQALFFWREKSWLIRPLYLIGIVVTFISFFKADISGAQVALILAIVVVILSLIFSSENKKLKIVSTSALIVFLLVIISLFSFRSHPAFNNNELGKALRQFSSDNITLNTRLISYRAAANYLVDHPVSMIFGVGHGNYALIFDKYFDPTFYNYDRSATYFDRAHSTPVDVITTTGLIGLITYLSIFLIVLIYLIKAYKKRNEVDTIFKIDKVELAIILGLITAYFVQNLAVFDSFATYLYFMIVLAFINFIAFRPINKEGFKINGIVKNFLFPVLIIMSIWAFNNNIKTIEMLKKTIEAYSTVHTQGIIESHDYYEEALSFNTKLERDVRKAYINLVLSSSDQLTSSKDFSGAEKAILLAIQTAEDNESYNQYDSLSLTRLSRIYDLASRFYFTRGQEEKGSYYGNLAFDAIDRAIESSPGRVLLYLSKASLLVNFGEKEEAVAELEYAKSLNPKMPEAYCQLSHFYFIIKENDKFLDNFSDCEELNGFNLMNWGDFFSSVEAYYSEQKDYDNLISVFNIVLKSNQNDINIWSRLALTYFNNGQIEEARSSALKILDIDPSLKADVDSFLERIESVEE